MIKQPSIVNIENTMLMSDITKENQARLIVPSPETYYDIKHLFCI
jgi:hypothetical protein